MRLSAHDRLGEIDQAKWEALARESSLFVTHRWLEMTDAKGKQERERRYFAVWDGRDRLIGALPCHYFQEPPSWLYDPAEVFSGCSPVRARNWFPGVIAGGYSTYRGGILTAPELSEDGSSEVIARLVGAAKEWAKERDASLQFPYLPGDLAAALSEMPAGGPPPLFEDVEQILRTLQGSIEEYVMSLPQSRRKIVRRELRAYENSGAESACCLLSEAPLERLAELHDNLMSKYGHVHGVPRALASLEVQREHFGDSAVVFMAMKKGEIAGFSLCYRHLDSLYVRVAGFDYEADIPFVYGNVVFYEPLRFGMAEGMSAVHLGVESYKAKLLRGADAVALYALLEPRRPFDPGDADAIDACSQRRLAEFWEKFGSYALHQDEDDLRMPHGA